MARRSFGHALADTRCDSFGRAAGWKQSLPLGIASRMKTSEHWRRCSPSNPSVLTAQLEWCRLRGKSRTSFFPMQAGSGRAESVGMSWYELTLRKIVALGVGAGGLCLLRGQTNEQILLGQSLRLRRFGSIEQAGQTPDFFLPSHASANWGEVCDGIRS